MLNKRIFIFATIISLSLLGIIGNYLHLPLVFGVDFIFGSISALIALRLVGTTAGVIVALSAGAYTYVIWGHPYAMIIFTLEALFVGILIQRKISSMVLADIIYWLVIGMPLVWFFYSNIIGMPETQSTIILFKQPVNGITNAIIATYAVFLITKRLPPINETQPQNHIHLKELLFTTLIAVSSAVTLILVIHQNTAALTNYEKSIYKEMQIITNFIEHQISSDEETIDKNTLKNNHQHLTYQRDIIILSANSQVLSSSLPDEKTNSILTTGSKKTLPSGLGLWMPERNGKPLMLWWNLAYYYLEQPLGISNDMSILLLQSSQTLINTLQSDIINAFKILFGLILLSGLIGYYISNMLTSTILKLTESTKNITEKLQTGMSIEWPHSAISELEQLSQQAKLMSDNINATFSDTNTRSTAIIEASVDAIITINSQGKIESFNAAAENMFAYKREDVIDKDISRLMPEPYQSMHDEYVENFSQRSRIPFEGVRREFSGLRSNGEIFPIELSLTRINLRNKVLYTGIISDITERKANEKLKKEFISTVSHELRTPLTSIQGAIKLLHARKEQASIAESQAMLDLADRNVNRLAELINDLLDFEKIDSDGIEYHSEEIALEELITTVIANDTPMAKQSDVELKYNATCNGSIVADPARLTQVLSNLISNAIKFSPAGESISIGCRSDNSHITIYVKDNGEGIADNFKNRIFQRFSQADGSDTKRIQRGTGLGLAIAKRMTEDMGGTIGFESTQHKGSTFFVSFPIINPATRAANR